MACTYTYINGDEDNLPLKDAYDRLLAMKWEGESISDVVRRLTTGEKLTD